jgi:subtilisin family serine protease
MKSKKLIFLIILIFVFQVISPLSFSLVEIENPKALPIIKTDKKEIVPKIEKEIPENNGYIIQLKEKPVLEKKVEIEKIVSPKELSLKLKEQKDKITLEHQNFLIEVSKIIKDPKKKIRIEFKDIFNGFSMNISKEEADKIKKLKSVKEVYPNREVKAFLTESVPLINADDVWNLGYTGSGIKIAIIDTGIDYTHPDLGGCFGAGCKVIGGYDFVNNDSDPMDDNGHGTHCAGIAAAKGTLKGVAPDAKLYAYKVLNSGGSGWTDWIIAGINRAMDPNGDGDFSDRVNVISMSLGAICGSYTNDCGPDDPISQAVDNAVNNGIVAAIAAGNSGPGENTIASPGTSRKAITVGATDKSDVIANFSSRGPVIWNGGAIFKPDVVAPGVSINSTILNGGYASWSGTSMATPHVAGAAALIKQAHPDWTPNEIKMALRNAAKDLGYDIQVQGQGRIDVLNAVQLIGKPPIAVISTSGNFSGVATINVIGTATAENFVNYTLYYGEKKEIHSVTWNTICTSTSQVINNVLCNWNVGDLNGDYILKLEVKSTTQTSKDFVLAMIKNTEITSPRGGLFPNWKNIIIKGTSAGNNFDHYTLEWCRAGSCNTSGITLTNGGLAPIVEGTLGEWNVPSLTDPDFYQIKLTTYYTTGKVLTDTVEIYLDPELMSGWPINLEKVPITVADLNNDGKKEIIFRTGGFYSGFIHALKYDGTEMPGFPKELTFSCDYPFYDYSSTRVSIADIDGDNFKEIVIGDNCGDLHVLKYDGSSVTYFPGFPKHIGYLLFETTIGDINNDGKFEFIIGDILKLHVIDINGNELPGWPKSLDIPGDAFGWIEGPFPIADFDKDGFKEIVVSGCRAEMINNVQRWNCKIWVFKHDGSIVTGWPKEFLGISHGGFHFALGDINKDGKIEIIAANSEAVKPTNVANLYVWDLNGNSLPGWPVSINNKDFGAPALGDVDGDGEMEIVIAYHGTDYAYSTLSVFNSTGSIKSSRTWPSWDVWTWIHGNPTIGNLDNDSQYEIAVGGCSWNDCGYSSPEELKGFIAFDIFNHDLTVMRRKLIPDLTFNPDATIADLNNDGKSELILSTPGEMYVWNFKGSSKDEWPQFYHDERHTALYPLIDQPPSISIEPSGEIEMQIGSTLNFTANATDDNGVKSLVHYVYDPNLGNWKGPFSYDCEGAKSCSNTWSYTLSQSNCNKLDWYFTANSIDTTGQTAGWVQLKVTTYPASPECEGKSQNTKWCDGNTKKVCDSNCQYSFENCRTDASDTDGGLNYSKYGVCYDYSGCENGECKVINNPDKCYSSNILLESYPSGSICAYTSYNCGPDYRCSGGRCTSGGGGGCPFLKVWDGGKFVNIGKLNIHSFRGDKIVEASFAMEPIEKGKYQIILEEAPYFPLLDTGSNIDYVRLKDKYKNECKLISAIHSKNGNITQLLIKSDDLKTRLNQKEEIILTFEGCSGNEFQFSIEGNNMKIPFEVPMSIIEAFRSFIEKIFKIK